MKKRYLLWCTLPFLLVSCLGSTKLEYLPYTNYVNELDTHPVISEEGSLPYYALAKDDERTNYTLPVEASFYNKTQKLTSISSYAQMVSSYSRTEAFASEEVTKILVVPISFADSDKDNMAKKITLLQNAFFGDSSKTKYESVASYYNKSSYGHVKLTGEVTAWYEIDSTAKEVEDSAPSSPLTVTRTLANEVITWLESEGMDLSSYKVNNYVHGLYMVYDWPYVQEDNNATLADDLFWAYVDRGSQTSSDPYPPTYAWSSFDFMGSKYLSSHLVETNTYIHETGHLFGLKDYYNTTDRCGYQPTGFFDMMDYNLGDHSSFSKYLLGWSSPRILKSPDQVSDDTFKITLSSFVNTGDFLLIPASSDWNQSPYGEYLLIEYFSPTGLNDSTSFSSYSYYDSEGKARIFTYPNNHGLRIYHVDARLAYYEKEGAREMIGYVDDYLSDASALASYSTLFVGFAHDNSLSKSQITTKNTLVNLLSAEGVDNFQQGIAANNRTLFSYQDTFGTKNDPYNSFLFNNGSSLPYSIAIDQLTYNNVTLSFHKK